MLWCRLGFPRDLIIVGKHERAACSTPASHSTLDRSEGTSYRRYYPLFALNCKDDRVRDVEAGEERPLESYQAMKKADVPDEIAETILVGLAQNDY